MSGSADCGAMRQMPLPALQPASVAGMANTIVSPLAVALAAVMAPRNEQSLGAAVQALSVASDVVSTTSVADDAAPASACSAMAMSIVYGRRMALLRRRSMFRSR